MTTTSGMYVFFIILGYLSGSILYSYLLPKYLCHINVRKESPDGNPGAFNAFACCGAAVGALAILCDLFKGFLPVFFAARKLDRNSLLFALVLAAPVVGHAWPLGHFHEGGKAIAVSFGVLLGLLPDFRPFFLLCFFYLTFSLLLIIQPHGARSIITFAAFSLTSFLFPWQKEIQVGCLGISAIVCWRHYQNQRSGQSENVPFTFTPLSAKIRKQRKIMMDHKTNTDDR